MPVAQVSAKADTPGAPGAMRAATRWPWPSLLAGALGLLACFTPAWEGIEWRGFDALSVAAAPNAARLPITLVAIDEESMAQIGRQWPWPRSLHARLLERLNEAGVAAVAFDVLFSEPAGDPAEDAALEDALRASRAPVILAANLEYRESAAARMWMRIDPLRRFVDAGASAGLATVELDRDGVLRRFPRSQDALWRQVLLRFAERHPGIVSRFEAERGQLVRYAGPPHTFPVIPFHRLLDADARLSSNWREVLRDNIVLVGRSLQTTTEAGAAQADLFFTPFFHARAELMPGAEIHANLLANMISGDTLRQASRAASAGLVLAVALLAGLAMARWHPGGSAALALALAGAVAGLDWYLFRHRGLWVPAAAALAVPVLAYVAHGAQAFLRERARRLEIRRAFAHYVPPPVVDEIIAHPEKLRLGGERRELTVLFTDLAGFTGLAERLSAEEAARLLNRHLDEMTIIVLRHGGTVDKFIGDAVMAFWGAPMADPDQSIHAHDAAVEMQRKMAELRAELVASGGPPLAMRIGVHRGECIVGNMGGRNRFEYTAVGDAVNLASRLEGANKAYGTQILVSEPVANALAGARPLRPVDRVRVKGRQQPVDLYTPCEDAELARLTGQALTACREGDWARARKLWEEILREHPGDALARRFAGLCARNEQNPPRDWSGVTELDAK